MFGIKVNWCVFVGHKPKIHTLQCIAKQNKHVGVRTDVWRRCSRCTWSELVSSKFNRIRRPVVSITKKGA